MTSELPDKTNPDDSPGYSFADAIEQQTPRADSANHDRFPVETLADMRDYAHPGWLIRGLLPARESMFVFGQPGSGKSFIALDAMLHVAAGRDWLGRRVEQAGVVYIAAEGGPALRTRVRAAIEHHGFAIDIPFGLITRAPDLGRVDGDIARLIAAIRTQTQHWSPGPRAIVIDTMTRTTVGADESSSVSMGIFAKNMSRLATAFEGVVIAIHHPGKDDDRGTRGSSLLQASADAVWRISRDEEGIRELTIVKMKDGKDGDAFRFALRTLTRDDEKARDPVTTCVVEWKPAAISDRAVASGPDLSPPQTSVLVLLADVIAAEGHELTRGMVLPLEHRAASTSCAPKPPNGASSAPTPRAARPFSTATCASWKIRVTSGGT